MGVAYQQMREFYRDLLDSGAAPEILSVDVTTISIASRGLVQVMTSGFTGFTSPAVFVDGAPLAFPTHLGSGVFSGEANSPVRSGVVSVQTAEDGLVVGSPVVDVVA